MSGRLTVAPARPPAAARAPLRAAARAPLHAAAGAPLRAADADPLRPADAAPLRPAAGAPLRPAARVRGLVPYRVPVYPGPIDLDLRGNEGDPPEPDLVDRDALLAALGPYPDAAPLEAALARRLGRPAAEVIVTAGADDAIDRLCRATLEPGRDLLFPEPGFSMTARYARLAGAAVRSIAWPGSRFPLEAALEALDEGVGLVVLTSPNNPTGATIPTETVRRIAERAREVGAIVLLDQAYGEFDPGMAAPGDFEGAPVVLVRTFSKARGLAGLRVGYAVGPQEVIGWLRAVGAPYAVSGPSLALARRALDTGATPIARCRARVEAQRPRLERALRRTGVEVVEGAANFVFARGPRVPWLVDALAGQGCAVRRFGDPRLAQAMRLRVPSRAETDRVVEALAQADRPEALIFDMDGVLADVRESYRVAIQQTTQAFGVTVTEEDITAAKAAGDANNDWKLSRQLILAGGAPDPGLAAVTAVFEARYQGEDTTPGLWRREQPLVDRAWLAALAQRLPLAIVTGRPRADALRTLRAWGWEELFQVVVTMEDGPAKPDPAPVQRALDGLGCRRAWMLGDTPDDIRAARAAGILPLGVEAPGESTAPALARAGAGRVLSHTRAIAELLP